LEKPVGKDKTAPTRPFGRAGLVLLCLAFAAGVFAPSHAARAAFPTTGVLDNFNRAGEMPLGNGNWNGPIRPGHPQLKTDGDAVLSSGGNADSYWSSSIFGPDSEVYVTVDGKSPDNNYCITLACKIANPNSGSFNAYWAEACVAAGTDTWTIYKFTNDSPTALAMSGSDVELNPGDSIGLECMPGSQKFKRKSGGNWTDVKTSTDSTYNSVSGYVGLHIEYGWTGDDFGGGTMVPAGAPGGVQVSSRSDTLSDSRPSVTSNHAIALKVNSSLDTTSQTATDTLTLTFASKFDLNNIYCKDVDLSIGGTATSIAGTFSSRATSKNCPGSATSWGLFIDPVATTITFYTPTGIRTWVNAGTQLSIKVGTNASFQDTGTAQIVNPSTPGTYTISVGGTFGGSGNIPVSINAGFEVQATVTESLSLTVSPSVTSIKFVQSNFNSLTSANPTVAFTSNNTAGNLIILALDWNNQSVVVNSITDTNNNTYEKATGPTDGFTSWRDSIYYAETIAGGANTVTIHFSSAVTSELYVHEYSGADRTAPLDVTASSTGHTYPAPASSGSKMTNYPGELVFGYCHSGQCFAGPGFTTRRSDNQNLTEDLIATTTGSYSASADTSNDSWIMSMATFKPGPLCTADDGATVNTVASTDTAVHFDVGFPNTFYQGCHDLNVSTNAGGGYVLTAQESYAMRTADGTYTILDTLCDAGGCSETVAASWVDPAKNGFGHTCHNQSMHDCDATYGAGADSGKYFKQFANIANAETAQPIMSSSTPAIATGRVKYRISAPPLQAAGTYTTIVDYIITATY
jgi:hypothetical protein